MEVTNNKIVNLFPHLFELDYESRTWYETLKMKEGDNVQFNGLDAAAKEFALKHILHPEEHSDAIEECIRRFKDGALWYKTNIDKLDSLMADESRKAIDIAIFLYSERECKCIGLQENDFNENNANDLIEVIQDCYESGIDWASKDIFLD